MEKTAVNESIELNTCILMIQNWKDKMEGGDLCEKRRKACSRKYHACIFAKKKKEINIY